MNCEDYIVWINGHIDGTNTEFEESNLREHLASCPHCRQILSQMEENDKALRDHRLIPPADLLPKVMGQIRKDKQKQKRRFLRYTLSGVATAAVLFLCVLGLDMIPRHSVAEPAPAEYARVADDRESAKRNPSILADQEDAEVIAEAPEVNFENQGSSFDTVFLFVDPNQMIPSYDSLFVDTAEILMSEEAYAFYLEQEKVPLLISMLSTQQLAELEYVKSAVFNDGATAESHLVVIYPAA